MQCPDLCEEIAKRMEGVISLNSSQVSSALLKALRPTCFSSSPRIFIHLFIVDLTNGWKWGVMMMRFCSVRGFVGEEKSRVNGTYCWCCLLHHKQSELWAQIKNNYCQICRHIQLIGFYVDFKQRLVPVLIIFCVHTHRNVDIFIPAQSLSAADDGKKHGSHGLQSSLHFARQCFRLRIRFIFNNVERRRSGRYHGRHKVSLERGWQRKRVH